MKIKTFLIATLLAANAFSLTVYWGLADERMKNFVSWTVVELTANHLAWPPVQPVSKWTNLTFEIPDYTMAIQITSATADGNITCASKATDGVCTAQVPYWGIDDLSGTFIPSVIWWGSPLNISVGFAY